MGSVLMKTISVIIAVACLVISACSDQRYEYFGAGSEVQQSIQAQQGWVPAWFPVEAKEIHVQYDVDSFQRWFRFKLDKATQKSFTRNFRLVGRDEAKNLNVSPPRNAEWWFTGLIQTQPSSNTALRADIYLRNADKMPEKAYLAISKTDDTVFLWLER